MMWSCTAMPSGFATSMMDCVIWMSAREGVGSPEGWLCTRMTAVALEFQRALDHLARIDRGVIDGAGLLHLVGDELVALVEEQQAKLLLLGRRHAGAAIVDHLVPGRQRVAIVDPALGDAMRRRREQLELVDGGFADAFHRAGAPPAHARPRQTSQRS